MEWSLTVHPSPRILVAEDSAVIQTMLRKMLTGWGHEVVVTGDGEAAWEVLRGPGAPRLAIVDWMMPGMKGPELCRRLRAASPERNTYVLMLTSRTEEADIVEGFDAGADDYLPKPFHARELWARVQSGARVVRIQRELAEAREALRKRDADEMTGLQKGGSILDLLEGERRQPLSVLLVEVHRFRQINESFGRMAGEFVLRECAERIRRAAPAAVSGRYGGEGFLTMLPEVDRHEAAEAAERIRAAIASTVFRSGAASFPVTCSIGVATREAEAGGGSAALLRAADEALLAAQAKARERSADALRASAASVVG